MSKKTKSPLVEKVNEMLHGHLRSYHVKYITFFVKYVLGFKNFEIVVDIDSTPKAIIIKVFADDGKEIFIKPKQFEEFKAKFFNDLPDFELKFNRRS